MWCLCVVWFLSFFFFSLDFFSVDSSQIQISRSRSHFNVFLYISVTQPTFMRLQTNLEHSLNLINARIQFGKKIEKTRRRQKRVHTQSVDFLFVLFARPSNGSDESFSGKKKKFYTTSTPTTIKRNRKK